MYANKTVDIDSARQAEHLRERDTTFHNFIGARHFLMMFIQYFEFIFAGNTVKGSYWSTQWCGHVR